MILGFGGSPGGGNGNPLQYSCLEKILCTEEPGGLQSVVSQRVGQDSANEHACRHHFFIKESEDPQSNDCPLFLRQQINKMNLQRLETLEGKKAFEDDQGHKTEKAMATHSSTLDWKIPWMEGPGGLQSMGSLGVGHN